MRNYGKLDDLLTIPLEIMEGIEHILQRNIEIPSEFNDDSAEENIGSVSSEDEDSSPSEE